MRFSTYLALAVDASAIDSTVSNYHGIVLFLWSGQKHKKAILKLHALHPACASHSCQWEWVWQEKNTAKAWNVGHTPRIQVRFARTWSCTKQRPWVSGFTNKSEVRKSVSFWGIVMLSNLFNFCFRFLAQLCGSMLFLPWITRHARCTMHNPKKHPCSLCVYPATFKDNAFKSSIFLFHVCFLGTMTVVSAFLEGRANFVWWGGFSLGKSCLTEMNKDSCDWWATQMWQRKYIIPHTLRQDQRLGMLWTVQNRGR